MFQSAPCTEVQGDRLVFRFYIYLYACFNPLPAPKYREILSIQRLLVLPIGFNPLPAPKYREICGGC